MAKLSTYATVASPTGVPLYPLTDDSAGTPATKNMTGANLRTALSAQPLDATLTALAAYNTNGLLTQTAGDTFTGRTITGTASQITVTDGSGVAGNPTLSLPTAARYRQHTIVINGQGSAPTAGTKLYFRFGYTGTITKVSLLADVSGSIVLDVWKDTYANYPPTVADTITAAAKPTISAATKSEDSTLSGWTTSFTAGDCFAANVDSASTLTVATFTIETVGA